MKKFTFICLLVIITTAHCQSSSSKCEYLNEYDFTKDDPFYVSTYQGVFERKLLIKCFNNEWVDVMLKKQYTKTECSEAATVSYLKSVWNFQCDFCSCKTKLNRSKTHYKYTVKLRY